MALWNWQRQRDRRAAQPSRGGSGGRRCRLWLEPLEDRLVPTNPGTLDPTFGSGGTVSVSLSPSLPADFLNALAIQPDGKLVAAGGVNSGGTAGEFAVARFNTDGSLDTGFGTNGSTFTALASVPPGFANGTVARGVALQPDGKILLAGSYSAGGGLSHFGLVRYNADGSLDQGFGSGGIVKTAVDSSDFATAVALQADGKIVVVDSAPTDGGFSDFAVVRYNSDGTLDTSFGTNGVVETPPPFFTDAAAKAVVIQPDGKIVVGGHTSTSGGGFRFAVLRYNPDGHLDPSFGSGGKVFDNFGPGFSFEDVRAIALQADGKIVATGAVLDPSSRVDVALARYNADGSRDTSFDGTGHATLNVNGTNDSGEAVAVQANGNVVVAGIYGGPGGSSFLTVRYNTDGTLDAGFGSGGTAILKFAQGGNDNGHALALQADGNIVVAGTSGEGNSFSNFALARYFGDPTDFPLTATGTAVTATAGAPFTGVVATFTDADPNGTAGQFTATITWGDGTTSAGTITANGQGGFDVTGTHTYAAAAGYDIVVQIQDVGGSSARADSTVSVTSLGQNVQTGQAAGVGFWANSNGQALINRFNGGPGATALADWLAATFPELYGANAGAHNLSGMTNAQVAAFYQGLRAVPGPKLDAAVLTTALNVYATMLSLGGTAAEADGFTVTADGLGADSVNVGLDGAAFGVPNGTTLNVYQLLLAADHQAVDGVLYGGDLTLRDEALTVFGAVSDQGGI
jgi:uncharacterized delta-60 repeat protein